VEQFVLHRHAAQDIAVGKLPRVVTFIGRRQHLANFQAPPRAQNHAAMTGISNGIDSRKTAYLPHRSYTN
jgi:hypothetical protein